MSTENYDSKEYWRQFYRLDSLKTDKQTLEWNMDIESKKSCL